MVNYPTSLDTDETLYDVTDNVDDFLAAHHNALKDALIAVETAVGITDSENFLLVDGSDAMEGDLNLGGFDLYGVVEIRGFPDTEHKILMDPGADFMRFYAGDEAGDPYIEILSQAVTDYMPMIRPMTDQKGSCGTSDREWYNVYSVNIIRNGTGLDAYDDLAIIDNVTLMKKDNKLVLNEHGNPFIDPNSLPDFFRPPPEHRVEGKSHIELGAWTDLAIGAVKQLHQKVKDQEILIAQLAERINQLEKN